MINKERMVFLNIAYMAKYQGNWENDVPSNGGEFIKKNGWGGEVYNFQPYQGRIYGYVEPGLTKKVGGEDNVKLTSRALFDREGDFLLTHQK